MRVPDTSRRHLLAGLAGLAGSGAVAGGAVASVLTPRAAEGPYYPGPSMRVPDIDNDLVKIAGRAEEAGGDIFTLRGTLTDQTGQPLAGYRIEIWQCDMNGRYLHPRDNRAVAYDRAFQGFGHDMTDDGGRYVFRTIKPAVYPGRAPHIHVKVLAGNRDVLTTQFYVKDHPLNQRDWLYRRLSAVEARAVSMDFTRGEAEPEAIVDIVL